jgi:hypothetical protein
VQKFGKKTPRMETTLTFTPVLNEGSGIPYRYLDARFFCRASLSGPIILMFFSARSSSVFPIEILSLLVSLDGRPAVPVTLQTSLLTRESPLLRITHSFPTPASVMDAVESLPTIVVTLSFRPVENLKYRQVKCVQKASEVWERRFAESQRAPVFGFAARH